ncbi:SDR family NAD(P)-dependent oxidoreductase [Leptolyngbya sp. 15MV]|nr:SDR family NAD(P)-dependent oxidoreductase [Leptolyngbya sp. 15MV]
MSLNTSSSVVADAADGLSVAAAPGGLRLSRLTLAGFKSFADRTEFTFDDPITGIVGPNGCGKSNVVDAIKWVLGERSSKSLRGKEMIDVIFAGSAGRPPSGMASVTLSFENPVLAEGAEGAIGAGAADAALVTGAGRNIGAAIARELAEAGAAVVVNARSNRAEAEGVAAAIREAGGRATTVLGDVADPGAAAAMVRTALETFGRLDILVNNAAFIHHQLIDKAPFWQKELAASGILDVGLRSAYVASWHAARMMVRQGSGTIAFGSSFGASCYMHGPAYGAQKAGLDKFAHDMEHDLRGTGVRTFSIWMGPLKTERAMIAGKTNPEQYEGFMAIAENPEFTGHIIHELAIQPLGETLSGRTLIGAEVARELGITDRGEDKPSYREQLGSPNDPNPAAVY